MEIKRCEIRSLDSEERWKIGHNEISALRRSQREGKIPKGSYDRRMRSIVDFMSGLSNRIDSDGVIVEFFVR